MMVNFLIKVSFILSITFALSSQALQVNYDIVYVRYPAKNPNGKAVTIPQGEQPYVIAAGADLMLLHPNGSEEILVDCKVCSVMDPYISLDGKTVYYSLIEEASRKSASWIYKIHLNNKPYTPIRLTFNDGFDSPLYVGNVSNEHNQINKRSIRDMAPVPLSDGRLLFTSNRAGLTALNPGTDAVVRGSVQQLYVMDDHNGTSTSKTLSNMARLETGNIHTVQHPMQLMSGEILFSSWQDVAHKFHYAMTSLFTVNPDGSNLKQFTEPHNHNKFLEHFVTQLPNEDVITGFYYPSFDYGYGVLLRLPYNPQGPDFIRGAVEQHNKQGKRVYKSYREFDRKGSKNITPHTTPKDIPAPNKSGKYSMPSVAPKGDLLVAYSTGYVNHFGAVCSRKNQPNKCDHLRSGIYLIPNANNTIIEHPSQLIKIKDDPNYNEIWPRAALSYNALYGIERPNIPKSSIVHNVNSLNYGEAKALVGTSSMYNREPLEGKNPDPFQSRSSNRELHDGNWTIQGAEAGVFNNADIYGVRIIGTPAKPFTKPISKYGDKERWKFIRPYLQDKRLDRVVARYSSFHGEKWEILGEFPLTHKALTDKQGNADSSWQAKIPAETPFLIQAIDKNGMTLNSELTWRALKSGEKRVDCGGCHAHSIPALDFETTAAGKGYLLYDIPGVDDFDPRIDNGTWDLTQGSIPILAQNKVDFHDAGVLNVEFRKDVFPILEKHCASCHNTRENKYSFVVSPDDADKTYQDLKYNRLKNGKKVKTPQISRFIRSPQARQSLLVWIAWNERLDGRKNSTRDNDIDYPFAHPIMDLSDKEKRTIARWVDMGGPIDFPQTDGFGYTDDSQLPIIHLSSPTLGENERDIDVIFGLHDAKSGIDETSINVSFEYVNIKNKAELVIEKIMVPDFQLKLNKSPLQRGVYSLKLPQHYMKKSGDYIITIQVKDKTGNKNILTRRFTLF